MCGGGVAARLVTVTEQKPLIDRHPLPSGIPERLRTQLGFLVEVDQLKTVLRASPLAAADRRENDAEHSWHLALMVPLLAEYSDEPIDVGHTMQLVVVHDLIEIYAGDTPIYDTTAVVGQAERERAAADRLFPLLPEDQARRFRALWDEFERRETPEARFAKAMDRLQPLLLNWMARGGTWTFARANAEEVRQRQAVVEDAADTLGEVVETLVEASVREGFLDPAPPASVES